MQHADTEYMGELEEELQTAVLEAIPVERRLRGLPAEERLRGLSPEEVLRRFTPEQVAGGLSTVREISGVSFQLAVLPSTASWKLTPRENRTVISRTVLSDEQAARLRELLERRQGK